jgi:hypothetical protein
MRSLHVLLPVIFGLCVVLSGCCCPEPTVESQTEEYDRYIRNWDNYLAEDELSSKDKKWLAKKKKKFEARHAELPADEPERLAEFKKLTTDMRVVSVEAGSRATKRRVAKQAKAKKKADEEADKDAAEIDDYKRQFVGRWTGDGIDLTISPTYAVAYKKDKGGSSKSVNAPITKFSKKSFEVGVFGITTTFKIDRAPYEEAGKTRVKIDGTVLTKQ